LRLASACCESGTSKRRQFVRGSCPRGLKRLARVCAAREAVPGQAARAGSPPSPSTASINTRRNA
jgi:hypothetical protein